MPQDLDQANRHDTVMDVTEEQVARVYGQAFLGAASKSASADGLVEELESLVKDVLDRFPDFEQILGSALISHEQKEQLLDKTLGRHASPEMLNFLKVLSAHGRLEILRAVARAVHQLHNEQSGRVAVELTVASALEPDLQDEVTKVLQSTLEAEPELHIQVDPSLIAGFVVKVGDTVYDGSIKTRFERARRAMVRRAIEHIETRPEKFFNGETR